MPQSLTQILVHLIFSTKNREPTLNESIRPRVHGYLATLLRDMKSPYVVVGGTADHVHLLLELGRVRSPAEIVEHLKRESSKFVKTLGSDNAGFYWQRGYGMFSVSPTHRESVEQYIRNQVEHHRVKSFQEEYREFLARYNIQCDEKYVWD